MTKCYLCEKAKYRRATKQMKGTLIYIGKGLYRHKNCNPSNAKYQQKKAEVLVGTSQENGLESKSESKNLQKTAI